VSASALQAFHALGLSPKKSFGQNFLADKHAARRIAELVVGPMAGEPAAGSTAAVGGTATVVEIGAGLGALTEPLLARGAHVVAIERDRDLCPLLRDAFAPWIERGQLEVLEADAKQVDLGALFASGPSPRILAGNLPYQLTGPLLERTAALAPLIDRAVFTVQAEVGARLVAAPGTGDYGALTVFTSAAFGIARAFGLGASAFHPRPGVDSVVLVLSSLRPARAHETPQFRAAVRAGFAQRRKTLRNAWSGLGTAPEVAAWAGEAGIDLGRRGETLSVEEFARFAEVSGR
jgi:16S rRNA (adenine1518-N6/adenine1519-N6)-dimethyltransferase